MVALATCPRCRRRAPGKALRQVGVATLVGLVIAGLFAGGLLAKKVPVGIALGAGVAAVIIAILYGLHRVSRADKVIEFPFDPTLDDPG